MTICVSITVNDGLVLSSDSASTIFMNGNIQTVYNHANKIVNLIKGLGLGMSVCGMGSLGGTSIVNLAKDFRKRLSDPNCPDYIDPKNYTINQVVNKIFAYYRDLYLKDFPGPTNQPQMGILIGGYGSASAFPELYNFSFPFHLNSTPVLLTKPPLVCNINWSGDGEAVMRLVNGIGSSIIEAITKQPLPDDQRQIVINSIQEAARQTGGQLLITPSMPIQDAIDFARFLTDVAIKYARFKPGAATIGGPIEIASMTRHEGFKWINRKHYFGLDLNPTSPPQVDH